MAQMIGIGWEADKQTGKIRRLLLFGNRLQFPYKAVLNHRPTS